MAVKRRPRIPRQVRLGLEYVIPVKQLTPKEYAEVTEEDDVEHAERSAGTWDIETWTIYIDKSLSLERRFRVYRHELVHALNDIALHEVGGA